MFTLFIFKPTITSTAYVLINPYQAKTSAHASSQANVQTPYGLSAAPHKHPDNVHGGEDSGKHPKKGKRSRQAPRPVAKIRHDPLLTWIKSSAWACACILKPMHPDSTLSDRFEKQYAGSRIPPARHPQIK